MTDPRDWFVSRLRLLKGVGIGLAAVVSGGVALGTVWTFAGLPVPASQQWVIERDAFRSRIGAINADLAAITKALDQLPEGEARAGLSGRLEALSAERAELCRRFNSEDRPPSCPRG